MNHVHTTTRRLLTVTVIAATAHAASGGDDDADAGSDATPVDLTATASCLEEAGFVVAGEADVDPGRVLNDQAKELVGLDESLFLEGHADGLGRGSIGFYDSADDAREANEAGASMRTDDVIAGVSGSAAWEYIATSGGSDGLADAVSGCLG